MKQILRNNEEMNRIANDMHREACRINEEMNRQAQHNAELDRQIQEHLQASRMALGMF
jgi:hypothetical protein